MPNLKFACSWLIALAVLPALGGCSRFIPDPELEAKRAEDEAGATGAGCRQSGRSLEDCFLRNEGLNRAGAVRGWREMDDYMRTNKIEPQAQTKEAAEREFALKDSTKK